MKLIEKMKAFTAGGVGFWGTILATILSTGLITMLPPVDRWKNLYTEFLTWSNLIFREAQVYLSGPAPISNLAMLVLLLGWVLVLACLLALLSKVLASRMLSDFEKAFLAILAKADNDDLYDNTIAVKLGQQRIVVREIARRLRDKKLIYFFTKPNDPADIHYKLDRAGVAYVTATRFQADALIERVLSRKNKLIVKN